MKFIKTDLNGVILIKPKVFQDNRGFFLESFSTRAFEENGIHCTFVQDNHSKSIPSCVLRGLHFQKPPNAQSKLIRATNGAILDVVVDIRKSSSTYGQWKSFELTDTNFDILFVPAGFAHGFCTLKPDTEVQYKVDKFYAPESDSGIRWNDPSLSIPWPVTEPVLSAKDTLLPFFNDLQSPFE
jgi:dTDP-4-dehydrorhamnose 3,5-epimerase